MSKKKVMPRSTMTLRDFHGGSIPSDLQLPSAPGMTVAPYERQANTWSMASRGYGGDRHRPAMRSFEDRASYFPNPANIGRNYDEDERRPQSSSGRPSPFDANPEVGRAAVSSNVWATRREADQARLDATSSPRNNLARIQEASAIDKVSSGRWQPDHTRHSLVAGKPGNESLLQERHTTGGDAETRPWLRVEPDDSLPLKGGPAIASSCGPASQLNEDHKLAAAASRSDGAERPRLKLLPRSKPVDSQEQQHDGGPEAEPECKVVTGLSERPRPNLKPRTQTTADKERHSPYGGARPRELVLRERGAEEAAVTGEETSHAAMDWQYRDVKHGDRQVDKPSLRKQEMVIERHEGRNVMNRWDQESLEGGKRDIESWRRPEEPAMVKHGVVASALELALSFSRASSITSSQDSFHSCFSRLTDTPSSAARYSGSRGASSARRNSGFSTRGGY